MGPAMHMHVYEHSLPHLRLQGCAYASVLATSDCKVLYATGTDKKIKEFEDPTVRPWSAPLLALPRSRTSPQPLPCCPVTQPPAAL